MENNITSLEEIVKKANKRLIERGYNSMLVKPLKEVAKDKGVVLIDPNFDSGIYIYEQCFLKYELDKRTELVGIFSDDEQQIIRKQYFGAQTELAQIISKKDSMQKLTPNLQKMLSSDVLISAISDYGLCYDFSKIKKLVLNNQFDEADNMASRDWFFMKTLNYYFKAKKIANNLRKPVTEENKNKMNETMKDILTHSDYRNKRFPKKLSVSMRGQREKEICEGNVNKKINEDLGLIKRSREKESDLLF